MNEFLTSEKAHCLGERCGQPRSPGPLSFTLGTRLRCAQFCRDHVNLQVSRIINNRSFFLRKRKQNNKKLSMQAMKITKKQLQRNKIDSNLRLVWIRCLLQRYFLCRACRGRRTCRANYRCRTGLTGWRRCFKPVYRSRCTWRSVYKLFRLRLLLLFRCLSKESHAVFHGTHATSALTKFRALGIKRRSARPKFVSFKSKHC